MGLTSLSEEVNSRTFRQSYLEKSVFPKGVSAIGIGTHFKGDLSDVCRQILEGGYLDPSSELPDFEARTFSDLPELLPILTNFGYNLPI